MKKITLFAAICCFGFAFNAKAQSPFGVGDTMYVDGIWYKVTDATNKYVEVTNDNKGNNLWANAANRYTGAVNIPSSVVNNGNGQAYSVTAIGESSFRICYELTSVTIPNSVTEIISCI
ncbi:MAG: leucine-rich repeat domain-containing protein [Bacteroidales bacterium]|nr:leucine-rich repeat domain-containing protein [Bacteroidales bacterium]